MRYVYPGDYEEYGKECLYCLNHAIGRISPQWKALSHIEDKQYTPLKADIIENGVQTPVIINIDQHKVVEDGHHRIFAAREVGLRHVPCEIYGKLTIPGRFLC